MMSDIMLKTYEIVQREAENGIINRKGSKKISSISRKIQKEEKNFLCNIRLNH